MKTSSQSKYKSMKLNFGQKNQVTERLIQNIAIHIMFKPGSISCII